MNKKFLSAILFGALMVTSTSTFVSCKDYDDDIDNLQTQVDANKKQIDDILTAINGKKFIVDYVAVTNGYQLNFSDGSHLTLTNGKDGAQGAQGAQGEQGLQGIQGPQGEAGATIVPKFKVDAEDYWMVSVDEGTTYEYVLNEAGNKIKATGAAGQDASKEDVAEAVGELIYVDEDGYINIGENRTAFKYNASIPSMICNEKDKTMKVTIDGQEYTLLMEGSAFNGLQTIVYKRQAADDSYDFVTAYNLYYEQGYTFSDGSQAEEDITMASVPAKAEFKVYPQTFSKSDAELYFSYTYKTRAAGPELEVLDWDFSEQPGFIWVKMAPKNFVNGQSYASSLDVKMYNQYVSSSDFFNVKAEAVNVEDVKNVRLTSTDEDGLYYMDHNATGIYQLAGTVYEYVGEDQTPGIEERFDFEGTYNLNDSINVAIYDMDVLLADADIEYEQEFTLIEETDELAWPQNSGIAIKEGIFELNDGVLSVKEELQPSAINEYAVVKVTTTVKSQVEGVEDLVVSNYICIQAVRPTTPATPTAYETIKLNPIAPATFALNYSSNKTQIVPLDIRAFETAIGGRDYMPTRNRVYELWEATYNQNNEKTNYVKAFDAIYTLSGENSTDMSVNEGNALIWYKRAEGNATDSLFLMVGPKTVVDESTYYMRYGNVYSLESGIAYTPYAVYRYTQSDRSYKYFLATINNLSVTRNFSATVKEEYAAQTIIGKWNADKTTYTMESNSFADMYTVAPDDAVLTFALDADKQNDYVKGLITANQLTFDASTYTVKIDPSADIAKVGQLEIDLIDDATGDVYRTDTWLVKSPLKAFTGAANLGKHYDPTLANGSTIDVQTLAATAWKNLKLDDYIGQTVVSYNATTKALKLLSTEQGLYRTAGTSTGIKFSTTTEGWTIDNNGVLKCTIDPTGTIYTKTVTVTVSYVHDWGTSSFDFTVEVIRDTKPAK